MHKPFPYYVDDSHSEVGWNPDVVLIFSSLMSKNVVNKTAMSPFDQTKSVLGGDTGYSA